MPTPTRTGTEDSLAEQTLRTLYEVAVAATGLLDVERLAKLTVDEARSLLKVDAVVLRWHDPKTDALTLLASNDPNAGTHKATINHDEGTLGRAFETMRPVVVDDYQAAGADLKLEWAAAYGWASAMAVPLVVESAPKGGLLAVSYTRRTFTRQDITAAQLLAAELAPALEASRLHAELAASERNFKAVFDTAGAGIAKCDLGGTLVDVNPQMTELFGYSRAEMVGKNRADLIHPEDAGLDAPLFHELVGGRREVYSLDRRYVRRDGSVFWGRLSVRLLRDGSRAPEFYYVVLIDITDHKLTEAALRASDARKSAIFESAHDAIVVLDIRGRILEFNAAAERLFGRRRDDVIGHAAANLLVPPRAAAAFAENFAKHMHQLPGQLRLRMANPAMRADGLEFPVELSISAFEEQGELRIVTMIRDLSEQHRAETAQRENEAKNQFMATMSHELRTPLNSILGFGQLLTNTEVGGQLTDKQRRYVANILASGNHLLELINDVLDMSKIAAGELRVESIPVHVAGCVDAGVAQVRPAVAQKGLELTVDVSPDLWVRADPLRVQQVVLNVLSNAVKFTQRGSVSIAAIRSGEDIEVRIADTGPGITPEDQQRVFVEFVQLEDGLSRHHGGTGLGLPICRRLLDLMGGSITVESAVGRGSTFSFRLPAAEAPVPNR